MGKARIGTILHTVFYSQASNAIIAIFYPLRHKRCSVSGATARSDEFSIKQATANGEIL